MLKNDTLKNGIYFILFKALYTLQSLGLQYNNVMINDIR